MNVKSMISKVAVLAAMVAASCTPVGKSDAGSGMVTTARAATLEQMRFHCSEDTTRLTALLAEGYDCGLDEPGALVSYYGHKLLGTPYVAHTLEGDSEMLTINIDELDCTTLVETLVALTRTTLQRRYSWRDYARNLEAVRYRHGTMGDYSTRMHYISDWILDNNARGLLREVTADVPHAQTLVKTIDFMTTHSDSYTSLRNDSAMVERIKAVERGYRNHKYYYVKKSWLAHKDVTAALRSGDLVGIVTAIKGLDISHMGIIEKTDDGKVYLLNASSVDMQVQIEKQPLDKYLGRSKNALGIRVFRVLK